MINHPRGSDTALGRDDFLLAIATLKAGRQREVLHTHHLQHIVLIEDSSIQAKK